ncbi:MAG: enoyl-CoA hydratase-related protein [Actinomycetota bacterium]|nr:enoyl-CoA hydratase-related protein [Actinomycetota bacterium]
MGRVHVSSDGTVRRVVLARPEKRNALSLAMLAALEAAFPANPPASERVAVVSAEGPTFCAGIDLSAHFPDGEAAIEMAFRAIERYPLPVVAVVAGDAVGGGAELALHCDVVVAADSARFSMPLARLGLTPPWLFTVKLVDVAGLALARELLLVGDAVAAPRLAELGVISRVVAGESLGASVDSIVGAIAAGAPLSLRALKAALVRAGEIRAGLPHEDVDELSRRAGKSEDAREGMRARLEKRSPVFDGC